MAFYLWSVLCEGKSGASPYWQRTPVESTANPTGGTCTDGSAILRALRGNLAPNVPTSTVVAPGDTLSYGELLAYTGTGIKLPSGTSGQVLTSQGAGSELKWTTAGGGGGGGTVTLVATGTGLTGGPITSTGTINFATAPDKCVLGTSTGAGPPTPIVVAVGDMLTNTGSSLILAGNTTTTKMFFSQTGTGTVSNTPQWSQISATDVTGTALTVTNTDPNFNITLTGTSDSALLSAVNLTPIWSGGTNTLDVLNGGTNVNLILLNLYVNICYFWGGIWSIVGSIDSPHIDSFLLTIPPYNSPSYTQNTFNPKTLGIIQFTNDTNVTITSTVTGNTYNIMGGQYSPLVVGWTGTLAATRGGTGVGSYAVGDLLYADTTTSLAKLNIGASGAVLGISGGVPIWQPGTAITKTDDTNVTMTLGGSYATAVLNPVSLQLGWSGVLTAPLGGLDNGSYSVGDLLYASSTTALSKLPIGTTGYVLTLSGGLPSWQPSTAVPAAAVTSLTGTANQVLVNGTSGSPQTGAITLTVQDDAKIATSLGVGVAASGVSGEISGGKFILTGSPSVKSDAFVVQTSSGGARMITVRNTAGTDIYVGFFAGNASPGTSSTICIGESTGASMTDGNTTAIGFQSIPSTANLSTAVGYQSAYANPSFAVSFGYQSGYSSTSNSVDFGYQAGKDAGGIAHVAFGYRAGSEQSFSSGTAGSTSVGAFAGTGVIGSTDGALSVLVGYNAGTNLRNSKSIIGIGSTAVASLTDSSFLTIMGYGAGSGLTTGSSNLMIGSSAGALETTNSNILYISNSNTSTPLLYGDWNTKILTVNNSLNATITVSCASTFQMTPTNAARASSASSATPSFAALGAPYILAGPFILASIEIIDTSATTISFTNIPATLQHLKFVFTGSASADVAIYAQWGANGAVDTGSNYYAQTFYGNGTTMTVTRTLGTNSSLLTYFPSGGQSTTEILFSNYCATTNAGAAVNRSFSAIGGCMRNSSGSGYSVQSVGFNTNTTPIGQIDILVGSGNFAIGTKMTLYGMF